MKEMEDRWLSITEICKYLGVSNDTIYKWIDKHGMPAYRMGRLWKFKKDEVDAWGMAGGAAEPVEAAWLRRWRLARTWISTPSWTLAAPMPTCTASSSLPSARSCCKATYVVRATGRSPQQPDPIYGLFDAEINGKTCVVEYEPDTALRDSEQMSLLGEGGIEAFFRRKVLPYASDASIDPDKTLVGYETSFTRHFYRPAPMRTLDEIKADIYALEQETEGLLEQIVGETEK
jgi:excisionase family DNA binding protein|nr:helix-turn-helix domain-containing protein [Desulforhabdus amnigena]